MEQAVHSKVTHEGAKRALICDLIWEGLNKEHCAAIAPVRMKSLDEWILTCQDIGVHSSQTEKLTQALNA